jgi:integrase
LRPVAAVRGARAGARRAFEACSARGWITPPRSLYDLRHTFATFGASCRHLNVDLSRYMGTSLGMIDRHYGHLARDGREHAIRLLDLFTGAEPDVHAVDAAWTLHARAVADGENAITR